jgi:diguanylate cyclase (GGDEF)-like protein/PAS domain S-box-containing protein/hemerythrin-like metal-binding protein
MRTPNAHGYQPSDWLTLLYTGDGAVDAQHAEIVAMLDEQLERLIGGASLPKDRSARVADALRRYADGHFAAEEALLEAHRLDPRHVELHRQVHGRLRAALAVVEPPSADDEDLSVLAWLADWLASDILDLDVAMGIQLRAIAAGASPADAYERCRAEMAQGDVSLQLARSLLAMVNRLGTQHVALRQANDGLRLFRAIFDGSADGIVITDHDARILFANPAVERITGYGPDELVGANPRILRSGQTPQPVYEAMWQALLAGSSWRGELQNRRKDGSLYWEAQTISAVRDQSGGIAYFFAVKRDVSEARGYLQQIERLARHDPLTGLANRQDFLDRLAVVLGQPAAGRRAVLYLNLDDFKGLNEAIGQFRADQLLKCCATRLGEVIRDSDLLARVGGDEFALLVECDNDESIEELAQRMQRHIAEPMPVGDLEVSQGVSVGIAGYPDHGGEGDVLLNHAALAMQAAKRRGRSAVAWFRGDLADSGNNATLLQELRRALAQDELRLHFQPQVSLHSGEIVGVETLVRWQHPERGLVPPAQFIPLAEESGLIVPMSEWILDQACRRAKSWQASGFGGLRVAVNLSARHFRFANLPEVIAAILADTGLDAHWLELEITEGAMMHDFAAAVRLTERIKSLGARLSLDDFGTGYSSLAYLSRFPIDVVKIDQSFIRDITTNPVNASIAAATIAMSHKLGKSVIAEGVEDAGQMRYLRRNDCDEMQGYFFARPMPAAEFESLLAHRHRLQFEPDDDAAETLLLVDDEPHILAALKRMLRREGYRILTAGSGHEALAILASTSVQVIVSDQRMPEMTGTEFFSRVRSLYPETVRIVLSGYADLNAVTEAINRGAIWRYLNKPWDDDELKREIRESFRQYRAQRGMSES